MENLEYFRILVTGYYKHGCFLKDYIYREFKKAENNHISKDEFFTKCIYIIKWLESEFDKRLFEQKKEYYNILNFLRCELDKVDCDKIQINKQIIDVENLLNSISKNNFPVNLRHIRGIPTDYLMDFENILEYSDLQYIKASIIQAMDMSVPVDYSKDIQEPKRPKENRPPVLAKYETIESIFNDTKNIQKMIDCLIDYETLNKNGELIKKAYHVLAISEALKIKGIIKKEVSITQRNKLFAEKFGIVVSDRTTRAKNKEYETLLTEYKELFNTVDFL